MRKLLCVMVAAVLLLMCVAGAESMSRAGVRSIGNSDALHNAKLAADTVNDTTLKKGAVFSFNAVVGMRDARSGYVDAPNGRGSVVMGGGVAAVASAIWLAIRDMECFSVLEMRTYGSDFTGGYVSNPDDAVMVDYANGRDFSFRYNGERPVTLYTWVEGDRVFCEVCG